MRSPRPETSPNRSSKPQASVSERRVSSTSIRDSIEICSGGSSTRGRCLRPLEHAAEGREQAEEVHFQFGLDVLAGDVGDGRIRARPLGAAPRLALVQQFRGHLEPLMFDQPADQRLARILFLPVELRLGRRPRQQHARLDVDQRRRHHQELARDVEVHLLHQLDVFEVLIR